MLFPWIFNPIQGIHVITYGDSMKRIFTVFSLFFIISTTILTVSKLIEDNSVGSFTIDDYSYYVQHFEVDIITSPITSRKDACNIAVSIWKEEFNIVDRKTKPCKVYFDPNNEVWLVRGNSSCFSLGGVPNVLIRSNGAVLAVWHDK